VLLAGLAFGARAAEEAEPFVVGIGQSINDRSGVATALAWLGVGSVRIDAPWKAIETAPGRFEIPPWLEQAVDQSRARGVEPLLILAYGNPLYGDDKPRSSAAIDAFARYAAFVAKHFAGRVRRFDLWNEWETRTGRTTPGTPEDYVALARRAYPAIRAANPEALVLSGGISAPGLADKFVERLIAAGGLDFVDAISVHPYVFQKSGSIAPELAVAELDRVHALTSAAGKPKPVYVTEMGYPDFAGRGGVSAETAAVYLARFVLLAATRPYVGGVWWYSLRDQGTEPADKEHHFGVLDNAMTPKPAAAALRDVATLLAGAPRLRDESSGAIERRVAGTRADGVSVMLEWRADSADPPLLSALAQAAGRAPAQGR
jgi:hypothetical protein